MNKKALSNVPTASKLFSSMTPAEKEYNKIMAEVSYQIQIARKRLNMNQKEFASLLGVTQGMVSKWESCSYNFSMEKITQIFTKLNLKVDIQIKRVTTTEFVALPLAGIKLSTCDYMPRSSHKNTMAEAS